MLTQENNAGKYIKSNSDILAKKILDTHSEIQKKYNTKIDEKNAGMYLNGIKYHLAYLSESLLFSSPELFYSALKWGKVFLPNIEIPVNHISVVLMAISETLKKELPDDIKAPATKYLDEAIKKVEEFSTELPSFLEEQKGLYNESRIYLEFLLNNRRMDASKLILDLVTKGVKIKDVYLEIFQPVQYELGRLWQLGIISVAQEHYCTASTQIIMSQLYPYIFQNQKSDNVFIGTCISGELHEIGVRMLSDLLELEGWDTYYLGANMPIDSIIKTIIEKKAKVIGLSATMTFHVEKVEKQIKAIKDSKECRDVKIIVGGYVFKLSKNLWKKVGADAFGEDLTDSLVKINNMIKN
jgi:methanogenic corrinoid protein MtbC1